MLNMTRLGALTTLLLLVACGLEATRPPPPAQENAKARHLVTLAVEGDQIQYTTPLADDAKAELINCVLRDLPARWENQSPPSPFGYSEAVEIAASASHERDHDVARDYLAYLVVGAIAPCRGEVASRSRLP